MVGLDIFNIFNEIFKNIPLQAKILLAFVILVKITLEVFGPKIKGFIGEYIVKKKLDKLPQYQYKVLNDVMIRTVDGTTQIDHIVVSIYGIFVIETKHYKGWIHGNEYQPEWTQSIYRKKIKIPNPIRQNYGHVMNLQFLLEEEYSEIPLRSIVVFTGSAELKNINTKTDVIYSKDLVRLIEGYSGEQVLDTRGMEEIIEIITSENIVDFKSKRQHVMNIRDNIAEKKRRALDEQRLEMLESEAVTEPQGQEAMETSKAQESLKCGFCGSILVLRKGKRGEFYGCSNFPRCRFTRGI